MSDIQGEESVLKGRKSTSFFDRFFINSRNMALEPVKLTFGNVTVEGNILSSADSDTIIRQGVELLLIQKKQAQLNYWNSILTMGMTFLTVIGMIFTIGKGVKNEPYRRP